MITHARKIDMYPASVPVVVHLSQYDDDFTLEFTMFSSVGEFTVETGTTAKIRGTKKDGNGYSANATINTTQKKVTVTGNQQMTAIAGRNVYELVLTRNNKVLSTANFILDVEPAAMDANTVESESVIQEIGESVNEYLDEHPEMVYQVDDTLSVTGAAADAKKTGDEIADLRSDLSKITGLSDDIKDALLACFRNVAWINESSSVYYNALDRALNGSMLPDGYEAVNYIQGDGNAYILTNLLSRVPMKCVTKLCSLYPADTNGGTFIGAIDPNDTVNSRFYFANVIYNRKSDNDPFITTLANRFGSDSNANFAGGGWLSTCVPIQPNTDYDFVSEIKADGQNVISFGGNEVQATRSLPTLGFPIYILGTPTNQKGSLTRIYNIAFYSGTEEIFNGVPCIRTQDGEAGLYDTVSKTFFANSGTGAFITG